MLKTFLGGIAAITTAMVLTVSAPAPAQATVFYDFVCIDPTADCSGDAQFGGFFEFSDAAVAAGSFSGTAGNWLDFVFTSGDQGGLTWTLTGIALNVPGDINFVLTGDTGKILSITDSVGGATEFTTGGELLAISESTCVNISCVVNDGGGTGRVTGEWVRRASAAVPEPGTLGLLGAGLLGLAWARRRRRAA